MSNGPSHTDNNPTDGNESAPEKNGPSSSGTNTLKPQSGVDVLDIEGNDVDGNACETGTTGDGGTTASTYVSFIKTYLTVITDDPFDVASSRRKGRVQKVLQG